MNLFEQAFYKGFKLSNYYDNFNLIQEKILKQELILEKHENNNFFFFNRIDGLLYYFINDLQDYVLKAYYIKILSKVPKHVLHDKFLKLNHFKKILNHKQMILQKNKIKLKKFTFISKALHEDSKELYSFFENILIYICFIFHKKTLKKKYPIYLSIKKMKNSRCFDLHSNSQC